MSTPTDAPSPSQEDQFLLSFDAGSVSDVPQPDVGEENRSRPIIAANERPKAAVPSKGKSAETDGGPKLVAKSDAEKQADRRALNADKGLRRVEFWISEGCKLRIEAAAKVKKRTLGELAAATLEKAFP